MSEIDIDIHDESVRQFVLSLPADPNGTALRINGKTVFRVFPVTDSSNGSNPDWTEESNARRCLLIDKEVNGTITPTESTELEELQVRFRRYRRQVAPLPLAETRKLLEELEQKATRNDQ